MAIKQQENSLIQYDKLERKGNQNILSSHFHTIGKFQVQIKYRRSCSVLFIVAVSASLLFIYNNKSYKSNSDARVFFPKENSTVFSTKSTETNEEITCKFPNLDPFDESIQEFIHSPDYINCDMKTPKLFRTDFESKLIHMKIMEDQSCCYRTLLRKEDSDSGIKISKACHSIKLGEDMNIPPEHEFISVSCNFTEYQTKTSSDNVKHILKYTRNINDMFAFVPIKLEVMKRVLKQRKLDRRNSEENNERLNVLILGLDAQSRMNFHRQMPLTYNFIMKNLSAVELKGYTKVGDNTFPNLVPILTGLSVSELKQSCWNDSKSYFDECPFIWKKYSESGYITSFGEDSVWMGTFTYGKRGFKKQPTDYYINPFMHQMARKIGHEPLGNVKLCYGPRLSFEVLLDYIVKTSVNFRSNPYFQFIWTNSLFHDYLNYPKLGDEMLAMTLEFLHKNQFLNRTALLLISDHGIRWGGIRNTVQGRLEERMPMNFWIFPSWFSEKYSEAIKELKKNSDKLTTPFDVHETLINLSNMKSHNVLNTHYDSRGISLFQPIPMNRTCESAGIEEHWCVCNEMERITDLNLTIVQTAAKFVIYSINQLLTNHSSECAKLELSRIDSVSRQNNKSPDGYLHFNNTILQMTLVTTPGEGIFEATISIKGIQQQNIDLNGDISRLNLYRNQSWCMSDFILQKYCFCIGK